MTICYICLCEVLWVWFSARPPKMPDTPIQSSKVQNSRENKLENNRQRYRLPTEAVALCRTSMEKRILALSCSHSFILGRRFSSTSRMNRSRMFSTSSVRRLPHFEGIICFGHVNVVIFEGILPGPCGFKHNFCSNTHTHAETHTHLQYPTQSTHTQAMECVEKAVVNWQKFQNRPDRISIAQCVWKDLFFFACDTFNFFILLRFILLSPSCQV